MMNEPIHHMFRRAAGQHGDLPAISGPETVVTYRELEARSNRLASLLLAQGARRGDLVAILAGHGGDVITGILATLKAGGVFVPLDPASPATRLETVAAEASPAFCLVSPELAEPFERLRRAAGLTTRMVPLDGGDAATGEIPEALEPDPDRMCYVYFTSGSTGRPKGICGRLKAIDHFVSWEVETLGIGAGARVSQLTSPGFDAFLRDAFVPLVAGGTVCVPADREAMLDGGRFADWIEGERLNLVHCTPSLFRTLLTRELTPERFPALRHVLLAGEPLLPSDVAKWYGAFGDRIQLVNLYGPSETTMTKLFHVVRAEDAKARTVPIGKPMPGARAIVVDEKGRPCPPGKLGEIYIRTPYRTLGYLNRPDLTDQVFVANPFSDRADDIVYKTGDLGRVREDGDFEFFGRRDLQVKIRGVRIEIGPIEDLLRTHPAVSDVAVIDRQDTQGNKYLCAYFVQREAVEIGELFDFLRRELPSAAIPSSLVRLDVLPRTLSGKIDRRTLPDPGREESRLNRPYLPPRTPTEEILCGVFSELLGVPRVGIDEDFFQLGGHSLLGTLLLSRIRGAFGVEVTLHELFATPTVEHLAAAVTRLQVTVTDESEISALLREIEGLSEEALDNMVASEALHEDGKEHA